jgi:hypothetical protein
MSIRHIFISLLRLLHLRKPQPSDTPDVRVVTNALPSRVASLSSDRFEGTQYIFTEEDRAFLERVSFFHTPMDACLKDKFSFDEITFTALRTAAVDGGSTGSVIVTGAAELPEEREGVIISGLGSSAPYNYTMLPEKIFVKSLIPFCPHCHTPLGFSAHNKSFGRDPGSALDIDQLNGGK